MSALLDFDALIAPIPGDNPAGEPISFDVRQKFEERRKHEDPADFAPDDPTRPEKLKKADWAGIVRLGEETLSTNSKDLLVAARMTEALAQVHGFAGLRDGLHLLRVLVEKCWERLNPPIEDGDLELRAGPLNWLDDADHGARFPNTVRRLPLVAGNEGAYGWAEWRQSQDGRGQVTRDAFEQAVQATPAERCQQVSQEINQSLQELDQLTASLQAKMGPLAPGLTALRQALEDCRRLQQQIVQRKGPAASDAGLAGDGTQERPSGARALTSRDAAYRQLAEAAAVLRQLEPHSPIPYLVQRAVELGRLPYPQLIKALIREPNVLAELNREMGIPGDGSPAAEPPS